MLVVLEAAGLLVDRIAAEWHLAPAGPQAHATDRILGHRPERRPAHRTDGTAHTPVHDAAHNPSRPWAALRRGLSRAADTIRLYRERRQLIRELSGKDDRLLADIGITRGQIREVADAAFKRGPQHASRLASPSARVRHDAVAVETVANDNQPRIAA